MTFWNQLDEICGRWVVTDHPFHRRFISGGCMPGDVALYASQVGTPIGGLAIAADHARSRVSPAHRAGAAMLATEYRAQALQWKTFERAVGAAPDAKMFVETLDVLDVLSEEPDRRAVTALAVICAIERTRPSHHAEVLEALDRYYGLRADDAGAVYFRTVIEHAGLCSELSTSILGSIIESGDPGLVLAGAEAALSAYWELYDALEREAAGAKPEPSRFSHAASG